MLEKIYKIPKYSSGIRKRIKFIGFFNTIKELLNYNKFYYTLLKRNNVQVGVKKIMFHTSTYSKICMMLPELSHKEMMKFIPTTVTHGIYEKLKINRREITYDKYKMYLRMDKVGISIPDIYYVTDKNLTNIWHNSIDTHELIKISKSKRIIAKPRRGNAGDGISIYSGEKIKPDYVYQEFLFNHSSIINLQGNDYCSTVRYVVYNKSGTLLPLGVRIKLNMGSITDNSSAGSIGASINHITGIIEGKGFSIDGKTFDFHPGSNINLAGFQLPNWEKCRSIVEQTCEEFSELPLIAFDLAITENDCKVIEINAGCGTLILQYPSRCLDHQFMKDFYPL